ncbi:hypothetical protein [Alcaligenes ammonioxydans]|uniref:hypothetical protein n=1 Tax=Alcaligenes ammonioxydans TaxID=2582914 RepID=UPI003D209218
MPLLNLSRFKTDNFWFLLSNGVLIAGAIVVLFATNDIENNLLTFIGSALVAIGTVGVFAFSVIGNRRVNTQIAKAQLDSAQALKDTEAMRLLTAQIQKRNGELEVNLEAEKIQRLSLELRLAPRRLSNADELVLVQSLAKIPQFQFCVGSMISDAESQIYAKQLKNCLLKAGHLLYGRGTSMTQFTEPTFGIHVAINPSFQDYRALQGLAKSFADSGLIKPPLAVERSESVEPNYIQIYVGHKPLD